MRKIPHERKYMYLNVVIISIHFVKQDIDCQKECEYFLSKGKCFHLLKSECLYIKKFNIEELILMLYTPSS